MGGLPKAEKASFALVRFSKMRILAGIMGGSAKKPKAPPPAPAPVRADSNAGEQAQVAASRREGLRKTINPDKPLGESTALGTIGKLGQGGEGVMVNTVAAPNPLTTGGLMQYKPGGRMIRKN